MRPSRPSTLPGDPRSPAIRPFGPAPSRAATSSTAGVQSWHRSSPRVTLSPGCLTKGHEPRSFMVEVADSLNARRLGSPRSSASPPGCCPTPRRPRDAPWALTMRPSDRDGHLCPGALLPFTDAVGRCGAPDPGQGHGRRTRRSRIWHRPAHLGPLPAGSAAPVPAAGRGRRMLSRALR